MKFPSVFACPYLVLSLPSEEEEEEEEDSVPVSALGIMEKIVGCLFLNDPNCAIKLMTQFRHLGNEFQVYKIEINSKRSGIIRECAAALI